MPRNNADNPKKQAGTGKKRAARTPKKSVDKASEMQGDLFEVFDAPMPAKPRNAPKESQPETPSALDEAPAPVAPKPRKPRAAKPRTVTPPPRFPYKSVIALTYVGLVLAYDALATHPDLRTVNWAVFQWRLSDVHYLLYPRLPEFTIHWMTWKVWVQFDLFKLVMWLLVPAAACFWWMDWDYFTRRRVQPRDWYVLLGLCAAGLAAVVASRFIPSLADYYASMGHLAFKERFFRTVFWALWIVSWLPAWEFMHRYFLLRVVSRDFPRFGWIAIPLAEGLYHVQKPPLEAVGMVIFSVLLTQYALRRRNILIPFLAHLFVEVALWTALVI